MGFLRDNVLAKKHQPVKVINEKEYIDQINKINETATLDHSLYNLIIKFKSMTGKTVDMLASYLRFDVNYIQSVPFTKSYRIFFSDSQAKKAPILDVNEWNHFDGSLQAYTLGGRVFNKPPDMPIEKIAYAFQATEPEKPSFIMQVNPTVIQDQYSHCGTIEIVKFSSEWIPFVPYFILSYVVILQMIMFYYGYTNLHDVLLKFKEFKNLSLSDEIRADLLRSVIERHVQTNGPLKNMLDAVDGDMDRLIDMWMYFYWGLFNGFETRFDFMSQVIQSIQ